MQSRPPEEKEGPWKIAGICVLLAVMVLAVFGQTFRAEFVNMDDDLVVYDNPHVMQGLGSGGIGWAFTHYDSYFYTPLTTISHMLDWQLFGQHAGGHHLVNVLLHGATAMLLFMALRSMTGAFWRSAFVAAIFAIHPLHVESVAWVAERKDVLSGLFFMLTLWAYARYTRTRSPLPYVAMLAAFIASLLSKPVGVTLPFLLLLLDYWPLGRFETRLETTTPRKGGMPVTLWLILEKIPLLALSMAASVVAVQAEGGAVQPLSRFAMSSRLANAAVSCVTYVLQMIYPVKMSAFYPHPGNTLPVWEITLSFLGLLFVTTAVLFLRRRYPYLAVGWLWYLGMLVPMMGLVQVGTFARADRFTYLSQIGLYVMGAWWFADLSAKWERRRMITGAAMGLLMVELMLIAWLQASYWKNSELLWSHALECNPANTFAHNNLGETLFKFGRVDEALPQFEQAIQVDPRNGEARGNLAAIYLKQGRTEEAIHQLQKTLENNPRLPAAHNLLGNALSGKGQMKEAIAEYETALAQKPQYASASSNLAWVLATYPDDTLRNGTRAVELANDANQVSGGKNPVILRTLAAAYAEAGQYSKAEETAGRAVETASEHGLNALVKELRSEIALYQSHVPFRQKSKGSDTAP